MFRLAYLQYLLVASSLNGSKSGTLLGDTAISVDSRVEQRDQTALLRQRAVPARARRRHNTQRCQTQGRLRDRNVLSQRRVACIVAVSTRYSMLLSIFVVVIR
jgi:hypothetical protein